MTNGDHFGVGGRVELTAHGIAGLGDDLAITSNHRADRHLAALGRDGCEIEGAPHWRRQRETSIHRPRASAGRSDCHRSSTQCVAFSAVAFVSAGRSTLIAGTLTVTFLDSLPTAIFPVSTSNAGACPPEAVTPAAFASTAGASMLRVCLMLIRPEATATIRATTARIKTNMTARIATPFNLYQQPNAPRRLTLPSIRARSG